MTKVLTTPIGQSPLGTPPLHRLSAGLLRWTGVLLVSTVWVSAGLFGLYILAFYAAALYEGNMDRWNQVLPRLYEQNSAAATSGIGLHFAMGGIILILGSLQLIECVRQRFPALHRWVGRLYVVSAVLAAVGGLVFIALKGTIGGLVMNVGFSLYGLLMLIAGVETYRHAVARRLDRHRAWALRLYALAIGSWLYRMDYGFWIMLTDGLGHTKGFSGPFDHIMAFFFYLPNLLVAELFIRARSYQAPPALRLLASVVLLGATGFLLVGTYYFTLYYWGPAILSWLSMA
ncbi:DUF2306 domain-containing protein [Rhabdobacter roseus]|uniref:Putative membrane protein n=1 Tax=Rhabdobacter roseus TaxID=1655419 RepID=A0A840TRD5_9BACT|nr:DUF2306 domain-containing protein [Rhabdobacter roseus]MBB5284112.1 putative membrane protein [Rhabdobacter roseus]